MPVQYFYGLDGHVRAPAAIVPSWLGPVGEWSTAPSSTLNASGVGWSGTSPGGSGNYTSVVQAWGGGVLATQGVFRGGAYASGPHLVIFGGGHGDYAGNELYAYGPLTSDAPTWARLIDPTVPGVSGSERDGSGYPVARHTYDTLVYLPDYEQMICFGAAGTYPIGNSNSAGDEYLFTTNPGSGNPWTHNLDAVLPADMGNFGFENVVSGYDVTTGNAWFAGIGGSNVKVSKYVRSTNTVTSTTVGSSDLAANRKGTFAGSLGLLIQPNDAGGASYFDCRSGVSGPTAIPTTGTPPTSDSDAYEWDETLGCVWAWANSGKTLHKLTPPAGSTAPYDGTSWVWTSTTPGTGAIPASNDAQSASGAITGGRFRLVEGGAWRGLVVMPNYGSPICVYRIS